MSTRARSLQKQIQACSQMLSAALSSTRKKRRETPIRSAAALLLGMLSCATVFFVLAISAMGAHAAIDAGTFAPKVDFSTNLGPTGVVVGDLDGDGKADIAAANYGVAGNNGNTVSVLRNTGAGGNVSFAPKVDFVTANGPHGMAIGDLDGDGRLDLVTADYDGYGLGSTVSVLRNTSTIGSVAFAPKLDFGTGTGPLQVEIGDLDGDGKPDLAITNFQDGNGITVSVLRNISTSGNIAFAPKVDWGTAPGPYGIASGDVNGDGKRDLVIANFGALSTGNGNTVSVLQNTSSPGTISFAPRVDFPTGAGPRGVVLADFDADGRSDLATTNFGVGGSGNTVSVLQNTSTGGTVSFAPPSNLVAVSGPLGIVSSDLDGDGKPDLAVTNFGTSWPLATNLQAVVSVFGNGSVSGTISFAPKVDYEAGPGAHAIAAGDVNQDFKPDLAVADYGNADGTAVSVLQNITGVAFNTSTPSATGTNTPTPTATPTLDPGILLLDDFGGSSLSSWWNVPFGGSPAVSGGTAVFNGGNTIESAVAFSDLTVFEIQAQYSPASYTGLCWTNSGVSNYVCWVPLSSDTSHFALFTSDGGETDTGLAVPSGYHRYAISRNAGSFSVSIDGALVYSANDAAVSVDRAYLSGSGGFTVDWACVYQAGSSCHGTGGAATATSTPTSSPTSTPTDTPTVTPTDTPTNTPTMTPTDTPTNTPTNTPSPTFTPMPAPTSVHIGDLDGTAARTNNKWVAKVVITVHDSNHQPLANAKVSAAWSGSIAKSATCTTGATGQCTVSSGAMVVTNTSLVFTIKSVQYGTLPYNAAANHDPDGSSNGTTLTLSAPARK